MSLKALALQALGVNLKVDKVLKEVSTEAPKKVYKKPSKFTGRLIIRLSDLPFGEGAYFGLGKELVCTKKRFQEYGKHLEASLDSGRLFRFRCREEEHRALIIWTSLLIPRTWRLETMNYMLTARPPEDNDCT